MAASSRVDPVQVQCRSALFRKSMASMAACELCQANEEMSDHIIFACPTAAAFWEHVGVDTEGGSVKGRCQGHPSIVPERHYTAFILLYRLLVWKPPKWSPLRLQGREAVACSAPVELQGRDMLWAARLPRSEQIVVDSWCAT